MIQCPTWDFPLTDSDFKNLEDTGAHKNNAIGEDCRHNLENVIVYDEWTPRINERVKKCKLCSKTFCKECIDRSRIEKIEWARRTKESNRTIMSSRNLSLEENQRLLRKMFLDEDEKNFFQQVVPIKEGIEAQTSAIKVLAGKSRDLDKNARKAGNINDGNQLNISSGMGNSHFYTSNWIEKEFGSSSYGSNDSNKFKVFKMKKPPVIFPRILVQVECVFGNNPWEFSVRTVSGSRICRRYEELLQAPPGNIWKNPTCQSICIVGFKFNDQPFRWYRGKIISVNEKDVQAYLVDVGVTVNADFCHLRYCPKDKVKCLLNTSPTAIPVRLTNARVISSSMSVVKKMYDSYLRNGHFFCRFECLIPGKANDSFVDRYGIKIYFLKNSELEDFGKMLIKANLAEPCSSVESNIKQGKWLSLGDAISICEAENPVHFTSDYVGIKLKVDISHSNSYRSFFVITSEGIERRKLMEEQLTEAIEKAKLRDAFSPIKFNSYVCAAKMEESSRWSRAKVVEILDNQSFKICFVDYGIYKVYNASEIVEIPKALSKLKHQNPLAYKCTIPVTYVPRHHDLFMERIQSSKLIRQGGNYVYIRFLKPLNESNLVDVHWSGEPNVLEDGLGYTLVRDGIAILSCPLQGFVGQETNHVKNDTYFQIQGSKSSSLQVLPSLSQNQTSNDTSMEPEKEEVVMKTPRSFQPDAPFQKLLKQKASVNIDSDSRQLENTKKSSQQIMRKKVLKKPSEIFGVLKTRENLENRDSYQFTTLNLRHQLPLSDLISNNFVVTWFYEFDAINIVEKSVFQNELIHLEEDIDDLMEENLNICDAVNIGHIVLAKRNPNDMHYKRGRVMGIGSKISIYFIDVGGYGEYEMEELKQLNDIVFKHPPYGHKVQFCQSNHVELGILSCDLKRFWKELIDGKKSIKLTGVEESEEKVVAMFSKNKTSLTKMLAQLGTWEWEKIFNITYLSERNLCNCSEHILGDIDDTVEFIEIPPNEEFYAEVQDLSYFDEGVISIADIEIPYIMNDYEVLDNQIKRYFEKIGPRTHCPHLNEFAMLYIGTNNKVNLEKIAGVGQWNRCLKTEDSVLKGLDNNETYLLKYLDDYDIRLMFPEFIKRVPLKLSYVNISGFSGFEQRDLELLSEILKAKKRLKFRSLRSEKDDIEIEIIEFLERKKIRDEVDTSYN